MMGITNFTYHACQAVTWEKWVDLAEIKFPR